MLGHAPNGRFIPPRYIHFALLFGDLGRPNHAGPKWDQDTVSGGPDGEIPCAHYNAPYVGTAR